VTAVNQNFKVFRGDSHTLHIDLTQADGTPYDPSLSAVLRWRLAVSPYADETDAMIRKSLGNGIAVAGSGVDITLNPEDTDIPIGLYYHELKVWEGTDVATTTIGNALIRPAVQMGDLASPAAKQAVIERKTPTRTP
jgi:hypothetical protein